MEQEVKKQLGDDVELYSLQDPSILADVRAAGYVTTAPAARLIGMYMKAAEEGVDAMLNLCSSVGEVADSAQDVAKYIGVPIVRVDEEMCREAVRKGQRIGVMATLPTTLEPTEFQQRWTQEHWMLQYDLMFGKGYALTRMGLESVAEPAKGK